MSNVLSKVKQDKIRVLSQLGWADRAISREIQVHRKTIKKYKTDQSVPEVPIITTDHLIENVPKVPTDPPGKSTQSVPEVPTDFLLDTSTILLPPTNSIQIIQHTKAIKNYFDQGLTAQRIYQDLVESHFFAGSYDSVKRYVRKLRKKVKNSTERLPHLPGKEAQVDFGKSSCYVKKGKSYRKVWLFKMTLCCSKHAYEELVEHQDVATFIQCHINAFKFFGGVPDIVTLDNLKSGVLVASLYEPELNPVYSSLSLHYNFAANPCIPRTPEHKGVVERDIQYTKSNALDKRRFESIEEGNLFLKHWNKKWARTRIHGSTRKQVWKHFCEIEKPMLHALPEKDFEHFECGCRKVDVNGTVEVKKNFYGVPHYLVGETVMVHYTNNWVKVLKDEKLIIKHTRIYGKGKCFIPESCLPPWKHPNLESQERYYCSKARNIGPNTYHVVDYILSQFDPLAIRKVRGILSLAKTYGKSEMETASYQAYNSRIYSYGFVKNICEKLQKNKTVHVGMNQLTQQHESIRPLSEYQNIIDQRSL